MSILTSISPLHQQSCWTMTSKSHNGSLDLQNERSKTSSPRLSCSFSRRDSTRMRTSLKPYFESYSCSKAIASRLVSRFPLANKGYHVVANIPHTWANLSGHLLPLGHILAQYDHTGMGLIHIWFQPIPQPAVLPARR